MTSLGFTRAMFSGLSGHGAGTKEIYTETSLTSEPLKFLCRTFNFQCLGRHMLKSTKTSETNVVELISYDFK